MNKSRAEHLAKMNEIKNALSKTTSPLLRRDYQKAYKRMAKALRMYDCFQAKAR